MATRPPLADAFRRAVARFSARLTQNELDSFKFSTFNDVLAAIKDIQDEQDRKRNMMNLTRIKGFLIAMEQYAKVVEVFLNVSSILCFVWGPMKFLLQVASNWAESFDTLLDAYQELAQRLPLLEEYKTLFGDNPHMGDILVMLYEDILEFHQSALRFFERPTWRQLFRAAWKDFKAKFQNILENLRRHRELVEIRANLIQFQESRAFRINANNAFEAAQKSERNNQRLAVVSWLSAANSDLDQEASAAVRMDYPGTGRWIFDKPEVKAWYGPDSTLVPVLWLNGIPGAGKTILTSVIVEECKKLPSISVVLFYCKYLDAQRNTFLAVARGLLTQLLSRNDDLLPYLYEQCLRSGRSSLESAEVARHLLETALKTVSKTFIIIDGIDECALAERSAILRFFTSIIEKCDMPGRIRGLFVSQNENDIGKLLRTASVIRLKSTDNSADIKAYAHHWSLKIQTKFGLSTEEREFIISAVCGRAEEMFLFAKLVLMNLHSQASKADLYKELHPKTFPTGFEQAYGRIVARILQNPIDAERKCAQKLLGWVVCARRPLKWHEIQGAVSINLKDQTVEFEDRRFQPHVKDICGSLIDILPGDRVALVHTTAEIYLIQGKFVDVAEEECNLATLSLHYLTFECFMDDLLDEKRRAFLQRGYFAFQDYAVIHWVDHLESAVRTLRKDDCPNLDDLHCAIDDFWGLYGVDAANYADADEELEEKCRSLIDVGYQEKVLSLITEAWRARKSEQKMGALDMLGQIIQKNRLSLENWSALHPDEASTREEMELYYGNKWYKCSRHLCFFFHEGFLTEERRKEHLERHERPYCCAEFGCPRIRVGYPSERELKKHIDVCHPDPSTFAWKFPKVKKEPVKHRCPTCGKEYTRSNSLRIHLRTHDGERPYKCKICGKDFVRKHDCERHELKVHSEAEAHPGEADASTTLSSQPSSEIVEG